LKVKKKIPSTFISLKLIKHPEEAFGSYVTTGKINITPGAPKYVVMLPEKGDPLLTSEEQTKYRSGVGMLLYLVKHSRPDIANAVRELTKVLKGATLAYWKALIRAIKYVFDTKLLALKWKPSFNYYNKFDFEAFSESELTRNRDIRASAYGFVNFVCGAPISRKSQSK
jgi:hypothetical protein